MRRRVDVRLLEMRIQEVRQAIPGQKHLAVGDPQCGGAVVCVGTGRKLLCRVIIVANGRGVHVGFSQCETFINPLCWIALRRLGRLLSLEQLVAERGDFFKRWSVAQLTVPISVELVLAGQRAEIRQDCRPHRHWGDPG